MKRLILLLAFIISCDQGNLWLPEDYLDPSLCYENFGYETCDISDFSYIATFQQINKSSTSIISSSENIISSYEIPSSTYNYSSIQQSSSTPSYYSSYMISSNILSSSTYIVSSKITSSSIIPSSIYVISSSNNVIACAAEDWQFKSYSGGDIVKGSDGKCYKCKPYPYSGWCGAGDAYKPISGWAWNNAWDAQ